MVLIIIFSVVIVIFIAVTTVDDIIKTKKIGDLQERMDILESHTARHEEEDAFACATQSSLLIERPNKK